MNFGWSHESERGKVWGKQLGQNLMMKQNFSQGWVVKKRTKRKKRCMKARWHNYWEWEFIYWHDCFYSTCGIEKKNNLHEIIGNDWIYGLVIINLITLTYLLYCHLTFMSWRQIFIAHLGLAQYCDAFLFSNKQKFCLLISRCSWCSLIWIKSFNRVWLYSWKILIFIVGGV